jgi:hypothetical protein
MGIGRGAAVVRRAAQDDDPVGGVALTCIDTP